MTTTKLSVMALPGAAWIYVTALARAGMEIELPALASSLTVEGKQEISLPALRMEVDVE